MAKVKCLNCSEIFNLENIDDYDELKKKHKCIKPKSKLRIIRNCLKCGSEFYAKPSEVVNNEKLYCSNECRYLDKRKRKVCICVLCKKEFEARNNQIGKFCSQACKSKYEKRRVKCICQRCGKEFEVTEYEFSIGMGKYCSKECVKNRVTKICKTCRIEYEIKACKEDTSNYCSQECRRVGRIGMTFDRPNNYIKCICKRCNKEFFVKPSRYKKSNVQYCSFECQHKKEEIRIYNGYALVSLSQDKYAKIDIDDIPKIKKYIWCAKGEQDRFYAVTYIGRKHLRMHRYIMSCPDNMQVDHINHKTLDNRKCNLRICTQSQNNMNQIQQKGRSSKFKGVGWRRDKNKWCAKIKKDSKTVFIGYFDDEIDAAKSYNKKAKELFGEFAYLNEIT